MGTNANMLAALSSMGNLVITGVGDTQAPKPKRQRNLGVDWFIPGSKRSFMSTTQATSDTICLFAEDGMTVSQARKAILWDDDAHAVLDHFIAKGFGNTQLDQLVKW